MKLICNSLDFRLLNIMEKKTCVITGATSGIGYGIAKGLAGKNF
jgi:short-subunit dehydrogenase